MKIIKWNYQTYVNDFVRCNWICNVNNINNIKVCFWKQTFNFDTCLKPQTSCWQFRVTVHIIWILFLNVTICFNSKTWGSCIKHLPLKNCCHNLTIQRAKKYCRKLVLTLYEVKPFQAWNFCELNFKIFSFWIKISDFESQTLPENLKTELKPVPWYFWRQFICIFVFWSMTYGWKILDD